MKDVKMECYWYIEPYGIANTQLFRPTECSLHVVVYYLEWQATSQYMFMEVCMLPNLGNNTNGSPISLLQVRELCLKHSILTKITEPHSSRYSSGSKFRYLCSEQNFHTGHWVVLSRSKQCMLGWRCCFLAGDALFGFVPRLGPMNAEVQLIPPLTSTVSSGSPWTSVRWMEDGFMSLNLAYLISRKHSL